MKSSTRCFLTGVLAVTAAGALAGPYSLGLNDPANPFDAPVPGFVGPHGIGKARLDDVAGQVTHPGNYVNPLFFAWASGVSSYKRSDSDLGFSDPTLALGPVTGDLFDVVSLGDLSASQIASGDPRGSITLTFDRPIRDRSGADFVVFENGFIAAFDQGGAGIGGVFAELAHVEVSSDGVNFLRFPSTSLTPSPVGFFGTINPKQVLGLAGKHVNASGNSWGTPFDIGVLGLTEIRHICILDVPGDGSFVDSSGNPVYDAWQTGGSGGFDLEAIGAISTDMTYEQWPPLSRLDPEVRGGNDDPDADGIQNLLEYAFGLLPWQADAPTAGWGHTWVFDNGASLMELTTLRDERLVDLVRELQVSADLKTWQTAALSVSGAPFQAVNGHTFQITSHSAADIASVGVIRRDRLLDLSPVVVPGTRFYQLKVTRIEP